MLHIPPQSRKILQSTAYFIAAWMFLNFAMNLIDAFSKTYFLPFLRPAPEVMGLLILTCILTTFKNPIHWTLRVFSCLFYLLILIFKLCDTLVPLFMQRKFSLYVDLLYIPNLISLLNDTVEPLLLGLYFLLGLLVFSALVWSLWRSFKTCENFFNDIKGRYIFLWMIVFLFTLGNVRSYQKGYGSIALFSDSQARRLVREISFVINIGQHKKKYLKTIQENRFRALWKPSNLKKLNAANVYLFVVESYGQTVFANPEYFQKLKGDYAAMEQKLKNRGFHFASHFLKSTTHGGASWLADSTLLTGIRVHNQPMYELVLQSDAKSLAKYFNRAGYRTVLTMPGTTEAWPQGDFYGFQKKYYRSDFDYAGPLYGWSQMADQYLLDFIYRKEIRRKETRSSDRPLFVVFVMVTSHSPFNRIPPYVPQWSQVQNGAIYKSLPGITFPQTWTENKILSTGYVRAIQYELVVLKNFIADFIQDGSLILIVGDHQPLTQVSGKGSSKSVPVHVISRNKNFIAPFLERGYNPGLLPANGKQDPGMETFHPNFLNDFSQ